MDVHRSIVRLEGRNYTMSPVSSNDFFRRNDSLVLSEIVEGVEYHRRTATTLRVNDILP